MRKLLLAAAASAALLAPGLAQAENLYVCRITDNHSNSLVYSLGYNTKAADGQSGSLVEVAYAKNNQWVQEPPAGSRPVWTWANVNGYAVLLPANDPGWAIVMARDTGRAVLLHDKVAVGWGSCGSEVMKPAPVARAPAPVASASPIHVPLNWAGSGWTVDVQVGSMRRTMVLDTGATGVSVNASTAETLVRIGGAEWSAPLMTKLADGREVQERTIIIHDLWLGDYSRSNVRATVNNDDNGMELLGVAILNSAGRYTIDSQNSMLILG